MGNYYLAVDIGASSGRHILGYLENDKLILEEVYRFPNSLELKDGHLCWNVEQLFEHIKLGIKKCKEIGKIPSFLGIDTWGIDFILLDKDGNMVGNSVGYRDARTQGIDNEIYRLIPQTALYQRTGIQKQIFNSIYQLAAIHNQTPEILQQSESFLMIPEYFNYLLTGKKATEYTNATTTQLVSPTTKDWDWELIQLLGYKASLFCEIIPAGTILGGLTAEMQEELGMDITVMLPATHDTGSAVLAIPNIEKTIFLSSGTWSLMGTERVEADCSTKSMEFNYTNEGGYGYRFRYLKNIMGLWMIQSLKKELCDQYSFENLAQEAKVNSSFPSKVNVNDFCFLSPKSMILAIQQYCRKTNQQIPVTVGEISSVIYASLAESYEETVKEIEDITGCTYSCVNIVGGGCQDDYLNHLTAMATGKTVFSGPTEATAIGNIAAQMIGQNELSSVEQARILIHQSFPIKTYNKEA